MISTVTGKIEKTELGQTLMHEHIICSSSSMKKAYKDNWYNERDIVEMASQKLREAKERHNIQTIVDGTPINLGRDISVLKKVSIKSGVNILASTGFYYTEEPFMEAMSTESFFELLLYEWENGIEGSGIQPAMLKCATSINGITETNEKILRATGLAAVVTKLPIFVHSITKEEIGLRQLEILLDCGVDPQKVIMGHLGDSDDIKYIEKILNYGCYIGLDRFGVGKNIISRIECLLMLYKRGWTPKIILSHDYSVFIDYGFDIRNRKKSIVDGKQVNYGFLHENIWEELRKSGFAQKDFHTIFVETPKKILDMEE